MAQYTFLQETIDQIVSNGILPIEQVQFDNDDFINADSKEILFLHKGKKEYFHSIDLFWIHSLFQIGTHQATEKKLIAPYLKQFETTLSRIDDQVFHHLIEAHTKNLKYKFNIQKNIFNHYSLLKSWNNIILVGEKENQYLLFFWQEES